MLRQDEPIIFSTQSKSSVNNNTQLEIIYEENEQAQPEDVATFLKLITEGEQDKAEALLIEDPTLAQYASDVTDLSGRFFESITGLQYAIWALDWHMWTMILKYLPIDNVVEQMNAMKSSKWAAEYKKYGDWLVQNFLDVLKKQIELLIEEMWNDAEIQWRTEVRSAQHLLPIPFVNEICHPKCSLKPCPGFKQSTLPRSRKVNKGDWYTITKNHRKPRKNMAVCRGDKVEAEARSGKVPGHRLRIVTIDYIACKHLLETRVQQRKLLKENTGIKKTLHEYSTKYTSNPPSPQPSPISEHQFKNFGSKSTPELLYSFKATPYKHVSTPMPVRIKEKDLPKATAVFLKLVSNGRQDQAERMLQKDATLALLFGDVTDLSGRTFKGITGFQYAIWALDWYMWTMILKYLPIDKAIEQIKAMEKGAWVNQHQHSAEWLVKNLLKALQIQIDYLDKSKLNILKSFEAAEAQWQTGVGGAQFSLPISVVNEYCHKDRPFLPCPDFIQSILPRSHHIDVGEWFTAIDNSGKLGEKFAVIRYSRPHGAVSVLMPCVSIALRVDHKAVSVLLATRLQQRDLLFTELLINKRYVYGKN